MNINELLDYIELDKKITQWALEHRTQLMELFPLILSAKYWYYDDWSSSIVFRCFKESESEAKEYSVDIKVLSYNDEKFKEWLEKQLKN